MRVIAAVQAAVLLLTAPSLAWADASAAERMAARADAAFRLGIANKSHLLHARKHFSEATDAYLDLHALGIRTPALYRSLGNAAVLADRWPEAIWAYHVGLRLDPSDEKMREQLAFVRGKVLHSPTGQGRPDAELWPAWLRRPRIENVVWFFAASYLLLWFTAGCAFIWRKPQFYFLSGVLILMSALYGAALWYQVRQAIVDRETPLVVMATNADFHRGNGPSYPRHPVLPTLPRGLEARLTHRRGNWLQIRLTTGETGWVHVSQALIVEP